MAAERQLAIVETSVLLNFVKIDRLDLLGLDPHYRFVITEDVRAEIRGGEQQLRRLEAALDGGILEIFRVDRPEEIELFASLSRRLGTGESSAIAVAHLRDQPLAIDDRNARKLAVRLCPGIALLDTQTIMVDLIQAGALSVEEADEIKTSWEGEHRFRLPFDSFGDVLA